MENEAALIEALCGRGWDAPVTVDIVLAQGLLDAQPDLSAVSVYAAATAADVPALRALLAAEPELARRAGGPRDWVPLLYACFSCAHKLDGRSEAACDVVRLLLEAGADPDAGYAVPEHANSFSALYGTISVSEDRARTTVLLEGGASPSDGNSTYHAVETFDLDLLTALCEHGIEKEDASYTVKHAIDMRWTAAIRLLLDHGADPNAVHPHAGETTLHWAVKRAASGEVIEWLLKAGADVHARTTGGRAAFLNILGYTPYEFALRLGHGEGVVRMEAAGAAYHPSEPEKFVFAVARGDGDAARARAGAWEDVPEADRNLLPHWAQQGGAEAVALGVELGFALDATGWMGLTAVHWAALRGDVAMLDVLLAGGAPVVDLGGYFGSPTKTATDCQWYATGDYTAVLERLERVAR
jgi:hypothetical protein